MLQKAFHKILIRRHFWRHATFSEISELYMSRMLRMLAIHISASFISIFLYQQGYSIMFIVAFWTCMYAFKVVIALPAAALVGWLGPKHAILFSNILFIPSMIAFALLPEFGPWLLIFVGIFQGVSMALYTIGYNIDFSKVKSAEHAGKEIAYMNMIEKITTGISPLIGGLFALLLGPQAVLVIAGFFFALAALPLLKTAEQVTPKVHLSFKGFPWHLFRPTIAAQFAIGFDVFTSGTVWILFTTIFIIGIESNNEVYAITGALSSVILFAALAASYAYGRLIDHRRGKELLQYAVIANTITHFLRPFTASPIGIAGLNVANETATTGYVMSYNRALFDNADLSGKRTAYLGISELVSNIGAATGGVILLIMLTIWGEQVSLESFFFIAAIVSLLILTARFPLFKR